ncbi:uncharacterized protein EDB93DRAFT_1255097 [Suillus bovinus]|uniref:uncharacterized protein n=1 Tax=Suillus bovinus TaxID=48563 RepID=UPI001B86DB27|nr:uncharacterized protein EDB93DRAFT_1255097 [Suillus bovinus]KAG2132876.1 hypothetical protein EDB93DRAFT_1255097 [Suillus bovinus]
MSRSHLGCGFAVAVSAVAMYDWVLTFGQEVGNAIIGVDILLRTALKVELVWSQRWSLMTFLYLSVRYLGLLFAIIGILCQVMHVALDYISMVGGVMLGVIMIARLHAMYQRSKKVLVFLVVIFLVISIYNGVMTTLSARLISGEELILSDTYQCSLTYKGDGVFVCLIIWTLSTVWEVLVLCLAVRIAVKHFRELRRYSAAGLIGDCFTVLMQTHLIYFAIFFAISCFQLINLLSIISADASSLEFWMHLCICQISQLVYMFVLGPRLILSVREYNAKLVDDLDPATGMTSISFWHISTSNV